MASITQAIDNIFMLKILAHFFTPKFSNNHRPRLLQPLGLSLLASIILLVASSLELIKAFSPDGLVLGYASNITSSQVFESTNQQRLKQGLLPLKLNKFLVAAAEAKAKHMFSVDYWDHIAPDGTTPWVFIKSEGYRYTVAGENLARDFDTVKPMVEAWMASPSHKANIIHEQYQDTGIAVVNGKLNGVETTLIVQMFGVPAGGITSPAGSNPTPSTPSISKEAEIEVDETVSPPLPQVASALSKQSETTPELIISPISLKQTVALSIVFLIILVIALDEYLINQRKTIRFVGRNLAHVSFLAIVVLLILSLSHPGGII